MALRRRRESSWNACCPIHRRSLDTIGKALATALAELAAARSKLDSPEAVSDAYSCPAELIDGARVMAFRFRADAGAPVLAQATYTDYLPLGSPSGPCKPVDFAVRGRSEAPLIGGDFVVQVERIVGTGLTSR